MTYRLRATAIPVLPCRNLDETVAFYGRLGFELVFEQEEPDPYAILGWGEVEIHVFGRAELEPGTTLAGCYLRVDDADVIYRSWRALDLPATGLPRISEIADRPWGMREFEILDPDGNRVRVGHILE